MRVRTWSAFMVALAVVAVSACGGGADQAATSTDTMSVAPPAATPPATPPATTAGTPPAGATAEMVAQGQQTFATVCVACHGPDAKGVANLGPNLTDSDWLNNDGTYEGIIQTITNGVAQPKQAAAPMMPKGGANITDEQVRAVAAYVWSLGGGK